MHRTHRFYMACVNHPIIIVTETPYVFYCVYVVPTVFF